MKIKEALDDGSLSLEDEIDYADMTEEEYKQEIERLNNRIDKAIYMIEDLMANNLEVHKGEPIIKVLKGE